MVMATKEQIWKFYWKTVRLLVRRLGFNANDGGGGSGNGNGRGERKDDNAGKAGAPSALANGGKKFADACCQTISTGSIISTQFFHEP
jgi:hypothetical protein